MRGTQHNIFHGIGRSIKSLQFFNDLKWNKSHPLESSACSGVIFLRFMDIGYVYQIRYETEGNRMESAICFFLLFPEVEIAAARVIGDSCTTRFMVQHECKCLKQIQFPIKQEVGNLLAASPAGPSLHIRC